MHFESLGQYHDAWSTILFCVPASFKTFDGTPVPNQAAEPPARVFPTRQTVGAAAWRAGLLAVIGAVLSTSAWAQAAEQSLGVEASFPGTGQAAADGLDLVSFSAFIPGRGGALAIAEVTPAARTATLRLPADVPLLLRAFKPGALVPGPVFCIGEATLVLRTGYSYTFAFSFEHDAGNPALSRCAGGVRIRDAGGQDLPPARVDTAITGIPRP